MLFLSRFARSQLPLLIILLLSAYEPYLMYQQAPSALLFYSEDVVVPSTRPALSGGQYFDFVGSTCSRATPEGVYRWHCDNGYFYQSATEELLNPFLACMVSKEGAEAYNRLFVDKLPLHSRLSTETVVGGHAVESLTEHPGVPCQWSFSLGAGLEYRLTPTLGLYAEPTMQYFIKGNSTPRTYRTEHALPLSLPVGVRVRF